MSDSELNRAAFCRTLLADGLWQRGCNVMGLYRDMAWKTAARMAELARDSKDDDERSYYARMRNTWITLANRCEFDLTDEEPHSRGA